MAQSHYHNTIWHARYCILLIHVHIPYLHVEGVLGSLEPGQPPSKARESEGVKGRVG